MMVLARLPVPGRLANLDYSRTRATVLAVGAGRVCLDIFSLICHFTLYSLSGLKNCFNGS